MKKYLAVVVLLFAGGVSAQTVILKGGMSVSRLRQDNMAYIKSNLGFSAGIGMVVPLKDSRLSLQPEFLFVQKGAKWESSKKISPTSFGSYNEEWVFNYFEIPVLAKLTLGKKIKYFVYAGPSLSIGLGGTQDQASVWYNQGVMTADRHHWKIKFGGESESNTTTTVVDHQIDIGIQVGGGVMLFNRIIIDARYGYGLSNLDDPNIWGYQEERRNRAIQFTLGVPILTYKSLVNKN